MFLSSVISARNTGNGNVLWPIGCNSIEELPWDLVRAIEHANKILSWQENMMPEDLPPEWMMAHDPELEEWFAAVTARRASESGDETASMEKNEYSEDRF